VEHKEVKKRRAWTNEEIREVIWCYTYCRQHFAENYKSPVSVKDVADVLRTTLSWKAPGRDQITNFWLKQLTATHKHIAALFNKFIEEDQMPDWLTAGVTFLIPKKREY
jgi:hypothetical protein